MDTTTSGRPPAAARVPIDKTHYYKNLPVRTDGVSVRPPIPDRVELAPDDIEITYGATGSEYGIVPDEVARALRARIERGWHEVRDEATGWSLEFHENHWMHTVTGAILARFAASPVPDGMDERRAASAALHRLRAGHEQEPQATLFVAGRSMWDADERRLRGFDGRHPMPDEVRDLLAKGFPRIELRRDPLGSGLLGGTVAIWAG